MASGSCAPSNKTSHPGPPPQFPRACVGTFSGLSLPVHKRPSSTNYSLQINYHNHAKPAEFAPTSGRSISKEKTATVFGKNGMAILADVADNGKVVVHEFLQFAGFFGVGLECGEVGAEVEKDVFGGGIWLRGVVGWFGFGFGARSGFGFILGGFGLSFGVGWVFHC